MSQSDDMFSDSDDEYTTTMKKPRSRRDIRREYMEYKKRAGKTVHGVQDKAEESSTKSAKKSINSVNSANSAKKSINSANSVNSAKKSINSVNSAKSSKSEFSVTRAPRKSSAYLAVNKHFHQAFKDTSSEGDAEAFKYLLKKTPVAVVLHHMHFLFHINRDNANNMRLLVVYNAKYNIVSRYFLKAMKSEERASSAIQSLGEVLKQISKKTPLKNIDNLLHFTPEFILMATIQAGDMASYDKIVSEWEVVDAFKSSCDLIAAFFGVRNFFADPSRFVGRQSLIISCICGGSVDTLSRIVKSTDTKWLSDYTMRKTREMSTPPQAMLDHLANTYGLKM